jgi:hypothetical protein
MANFKRQMSGGASVAAGPLRPHGNRLATGQVDSYWKGGGGGGPIPGLQYLVLGGGNAAGGTYHGGGSAGSYRSSIAGETSARGAALESVLEVPTGTALTVTVGAGGSSSVFHTITAAAGTNGGFYQGGGDGGAVAAAYAGGTGNNGIDYYFRGGGGGGQGGVGGNASGFASNSTGYGGNGGAGKTTTATGVSYTIAGGGGGGSYGENDGNNVCSLPGSGQLAVDQDHIINKTQETALMLTPREHLVRPIRVLVVAAECTQLIFRNLVVLGL